MRKYSTPLLMGIFFMSFSMYAQNQPSINDLLDRLSGNHIGSVTDVFSSEEILLLRDHFDAINTNSAAQEGGGTITLFGIENTTEQMGSYRVDNAELFENLGISPISNPDFEGAGAFRESTQSFIVITNNELAFEVDKTGLYTPMGSISAPPGENFTGLEFQPGTDNLFGISTDGTTGTSSLSMIDLSAMTATPVGNTGLMLPINLGVDGDGNFTTLDIDSDTICILDEFGALITSFPAGFDADFGQGMGYDPNQDMIFMAAFNASSFQSELRTVDLVGEVTNLISPIGTMEPGGIVQIGWTSIPDEQLGINGHLFDDFSFYPNPAGDKLTVNSSSEIESIEIHNILGQQVLKQKIEALSASIDLANLSAGNYILFASVNGEKGSFKLIKQ